MSEIRVLKQVLQQHKTIAVVGLSADWFRPSYFAAKYMQEHGYRIVPVNPRYAGQKVLGETCYASVLDIPHAIDMVDVFRKSSEVLPIAQQAIDKGARCLWQQLEVMNTDAETLVRQAGLDAVMNRCVKIEHARLFGGLHWAGVNTRIISAKRPV